MNGAARIVAERSRAATRVLAALLVHGRRGQAGHAPDFDWLDGLLAYVEHTVRGVHHAAEETFLLKPLEQLRPDLRPRLARARREHVGAGGYCFRMREALDFWQKGWPRGNEMFVDNARDHLRLSAAHGRLLRHTLLPAAEAAFAPSHWRALQAAVGGAPGNALAGCRTRGEFEAALCRVMGRTSPPLPEKMRRAA